MSAPETPAVPDSEREIARERKQFSDLSREAAFSEDRRETPSPGDPPEADAR